MALRPRRGHLGPRRRRAHPGRRGPRPGLGRPGRSRRLAAGDRDVPRRAHRDLVGGAEAGRAGGGRNSARRLVVATADPATLPDKVTWYLVTNLPRPGGPARACSPHPAASAAEIVPGMTASATGSSRTATSRSKTSWAGPTSRSAPMSRSAATRPWSTARSASAGTPGSPIIRHGMRVRHRGRDPAAERGGPSAAAPPPAPSWPRALRAIRAWLSPWIALQRWWPAWSVRPRHRSCRP